MRRLFPSALTALAVPMITTTPCAGFVMKGIAVPASFSLPARNSAALTMQMKRPSFAPPSLRALSTSAAAAAIAGTAVVPLPSAAEVTNAAVSASGQQLLMELGLYLAQTVIAWGVPAAVSAFVVFI